jgi:hypothetical protein
VGVDHGRFQAGMSQKLLDDADVVIGLQQVGGEGVVEDVRSDSLGDFPIG